MLRHLPGLALFFALVVGHAAPGFTAAYEVTGIRVGIQSQNAVKARDEAIIKAQRIGLATLTGVTADKTATVTDAQISRLVRGFSVQGERVASRSYSATFSIRFNPGATQNIAAVSGLSILPTAQQGSLVATAGSFDRNKPNATPADVTLTPSGDAVSTVVASAATEDNAIIVLPVLDIGPRRNLWEEPNPWRDTWQKGQNTLGGVPIVVPVGDISDVGDVPDAGFLTGNPVDLKNMFVRYKAVRAFIVVAKNESDGMLLSIYTHDGTALTFLKKQVIRPRPGYLFEDAVPAAIRLMAGSAGTDAPSGATLQTASEVANTPAPTITPVTGSLTVVVPYQSLPQWVAIQKRLRLVTGVRTVTPIRLSPSSAQVRIGNNAQSFEELQSSMAQQGFDLRKMPGGEVALTEQGQ